MTAVTLVGIAQLVIVALGGYLFMHYQTFKGKFFLGVVVVVVTPFLGVLVGLISSPGNIMPTYLFTAVLAFGIILRYVQSLIFKNRRLGKGASQ